MALNAAERPEDLEADVPELVTAILRGGSLWTPHPPWDFRQVMAWLAKRDGRLASQMVSFSYRAPYARALLAAATLAGYLEPRRKPGYVTEDDQEHWAVLPKAKEDFSPIHAIADSLVPRDKVFLVATQQPRSQDFGTSLPEMLKKAHDAVMGVDIAIGIDRAKKDVTVAAVVLKRRK